MNILLVKKQQITEQAKFTCSPLGKAFEKQTKAIEDRGKKPGYCFKIFRIFETKRSKRYKTN